MGGIAKTSRAGRDASGCASRYLSSAGVGQFAVDQAVAPSLAEATTINVGDAHELDRAVTAFAREPNGGLIMTAAPSTVVHRDLIVALRPGTNYQRSISIALPSLTAD